MNNFQQVDCACLIHGDRYSIDYVVRLNNMLTRWFSIPVRLHVYTESGRDIPSEFIKHDLVDWGFGGPRSSWWYKLQIFDSDHHDGRMIYFDLDTVIVGNLDWLLLLTVDEYLWGVRDFKYLWKSGSHSMNSSVMLWDTHHYRWLLDRFIGDRVDHVRGLFAGDQDYINQWVKIPQLRLFDEDRVLSWRWQALDGGYNFSERRHRRVGEGTVVDDRASILVFHGDPKPDEVSDPVIVSNWR